MAIAKVEGLGDDSAISENFHADKIGKIKTQFIIYLALEEVALLKKYFQGSQAIVSRLSLWLELDLELDKFISDSFWGLESC